MEALVKQAKKIEFGLFSPQAGLSYHALLSRASMLEKLGYHSIWLVDHMWPRGLPDVDLLECLTLLSALAARTDKLRLGVLVLCQSFRNPALLAKSLATIDHISNGRLEVGVGAGWMEEEYRAYGYEFPPIAARLKQLEETLQILKAMFTERRASLEGTFYRVSDAPNTPKPLQTPHPPITIGGSGEKVMLRLVAQYADRWNLPAGYRSLDDKLAAFQRHREAAGRAPEAIEISEQLLVCLGRSEEEVEQKWKLARGLKPFVYTGIKGTPAQIIEALKARVAKGITMFTILFSDFAPPETIEMFANEVMPAFATT
jgi:F420-dependent oxidoreductase-like protein